MKVFVPVDDAALEAGKTPRLVPYSVDRLCLRAYAMDPLVELERQRSVLAEPKRRECAAVELEDVSSRSFTAIRRTA